ncbi:MAG TPA: translocation/assembly module TamB domain-containing protein [Vicinamibacterales bacterium]|nr:translocation/assembly module TamB domain-containing protein [Vicinamibacterales bacterium]
MTAAIIAALVVALLTVDLGRVPGLNLEERASRAGTGFLQRPLHIGNISATLRPGLFVIDDILIEGRSAADRPFLKAGRIAVQLDWSALWRNEIVFEVTMTDWAMVVERWGDNTHNVPNLRGPGGGSSGAPLPFRPRLLFVNASRGQFVYDDHGAPWSVDAPNLNVYVARNNALGRYDGTARFSDGTVRISQFLPMWAHFSTRFTLDGGLVRLHQIDLETDGAASRVTGVVDFGNWPEQRYEVLSTVDFPRMREIFFANEDWTFEGVGRFDGFFQLFKEGRELSGRFTSGRAGVNGIEFDNLAGSLTWLTDRFEVHRADADLYGGRVALTYGLAPLGSPGGATASFSADYDAVELPAIVRYVGWSGLEPQGRLAGRVAMTWPNGRFGQGVSGEGQTTITAPDGATLTGPALPSTPYVFRPPPQPFDGYAPLGPFPVAGRVAYTFGPSGLTFLESTAATPSTFITFSGPSGGGTSDIAFRATSVDWLESDRLLAAVLTARGSRTRAIEVGGRGVFDGRMVGPLNAPRISGRFTSQALRAWDVEWGDATGDLVVEGGYVTITGGEVRGDDGATIRTDGRFALGFRDDGAEEINARFAIAGWPMVDLRRAFGLDDWPVDGTLAEITLELNGPYRGPFGAGRLRIEPGVAWGERFDSAAGNLSFEGDGLQIRGITMAKAGGVVRGAARIGWDNTYDFDADGERIPVEALDNFTFDRAPLTGVLRFTATGGGSFDDPVYEVSPVIPDLYAGNEFVGQVSGRFVVRGELMTIDNFVATSPQGTISGSGRLALTDDAEAVFDLNVLEQSLDPFLRLFGPDLADYAVATASGRVRVVGPLSRAGDLTVTASVDAATLRLLEFNLRNDGPLRLSLGANQFAIDQMRLVGVDTSLELSGGVDLGASTVDIGMTGGANLAILQLFFPDVRASGAASVEARIVGRTDAFNLSGQGEIRAGRLRHSDFSHSLTEINGPIVFDRTGVNLDGVSARLGDGRVRFGGSILLRGATLEEFNVRATGTAMNLRYPEGLRSTVNAELTLTGTLDSPRLTGNVDVLRATYRTPLDPNAGLLGYFAAAAGGAAPGPEPVATVETTGFPVEFDIRLTATRLPEPVIQLPDATIWASADLTLTGTTDRPQLVGSIQLDQGELFFAGNRYTMRRGSIDFLGGTDGFEPYFDVEVETRIRVPGQGIAGQNYRVSLRVTGTQDSITPTFESDPPLASAIDVLALVFGELPDFGQVEQRALASPQQAQAILLRSAAAQLLTSPISSGVERAVQQFVPIDTLAITPLLGNESTLQSLNPTARITVGQRLSSRVFLTYSRTLSNASQYELILLEYDQNDRLSWVLSRNEDRTFALDFRIRYVF